MNAAVAPALGSAHPGARTPMLLLLGLALGLFLAGLFRPFTEVTKLWLFADEVSVYQGLLTLFREQELFLFGILLIFTVVFPALKITALLWVWLRPGLSVARMTRIQALVAHLSKWSMLDVFVVAVLVILIRSGGWATIKAQDGLLFFCASVLLTQVAAEWTGRITRRQPLVPGAAN